MDIKQWLTLFFECSREPAFKYALDLGLVDHRDFHPMIFRDFQSMGLLCYIHQFYYLDKNILKYLAKTLKGCFRDVMEETTYNFICTVYLNFGLDIFKKMFSNGCLPYFYSKKIYRDLKKYGVAGTRFCEYISNMKNRDVMALADSFLGTYYDYLEMETAVTGKVRDKYPEYLISAHDRAAIAYAELSKLNKDSPDFSRVMSKYRHLSFNSAYTDFAIVVPEKSNELVIEGRELSHCVSHYVGKVCDGDCAIFFLRKKDHLDEPYLTVEISKGNKLTEVEGKNKRTELSEDEKVALNEWAMANKFIVTAANVVISKEEYSEWISKNRIAA